MISKLKAQVGTQFTSKMEVRASERRNTPARISMERAWKYDVRGVSLRPSLSLSLSRRLHRHKHLLLFRLLQGMLNDLTTALDHEKKFKEFKEKDSEKGKCDLDVSVQVLTTGNWPTYKKPELALPAVMQPAVDQFGRFFESDAEKRKVRGGGGGGAIHSLPVLLASAPC